MGLVASLLTAVGCGSASKRPRLADYQVTLHARRALQLDPAFASTGRFEIVAGSGLVIELASTQGASAIARDTAAYWTVAIELPASAEATQPIDVKLDGAPIVARVAGEGVVYLARGGTGTVRLLRTSEPVTGEIDLSLAPPDVDLISLGRYRIAGAFRAKVR
jgi:hypothetical protein